MDGCVAKTEEEEEAMNGWIDIAHIGQPHTLEWLDGGTECAKCLGNVIVFAYAFCASDWLA